MDSAKLKKLQDYSFFLTQQAEAKEARGESAEAVKDYVKLVDVLLLLANEAKDHPTWQQLIGKAEEYQRKARTLAEPGADRGNPSSPAAIVPYGGRTERVDPVVNSTPEASGSLSAANRFRTLRKFPSLIGRMGEAVSSSNAVETTPVKAWSGEVIKKSTQQTTMNNGGPELVRPNISGGGAQVSALAVDGKVEAASHPAYPRLLEENAKLQREVETLREKEKEYLEAIGAKDKMYVEAVSSMVPKSEYDILLGKLEDSVSRADYEQALAVSAVPKGRYIELQSQLTDLELRLANSVPRSLVDDIAEYVSFLSSTVLSPPSLEEKEKKMDEYVAQAQRNEEGPGNSLGAAST